MKKKETKKVVSKKFNSSLIAVASIVITVTVIILLLPSRLSRMKPQASVVDNKEGGLGTQVSQALEQSEPEAVEELIIFETPQSGKEITINSVLFFKPGFVIVLDETDGKVIGQSELLTEGISTNVKIELVKEVVNGEALIIALLNDDGSGEFESDTDQAVVDQYSEPYVYYLYVEDEVVTMPPDNVILPQDLQ